MQRLRSPRNKGDGPPMFSQEFILQNHADILSCVCMVIFMLLIPQVTNPYASRLIFVHNNVSNIVEQKQDTSSVRLDKREVVETYYRHGLSDILNVVFYGMVWIIIHALLQEYIWERTVKRLHLSKVKTTKYYDSGCLAVFYFISLVWGVDIILSCGYATNPTLLWREYPHTLMSLSLKFFMLTQMAFWLHCYPELIFTKTKKEDIYSKIVLYTSSLLIIAGAYTMMLQRVAVVLLVLHYSVEFLYHTCRMLNYYGKNDLAGPGFRVWQVFFIVARIATVIIAIVTLWFGIGQQPTVAVEDMEVEVEVEGEEEGEGRGPFTIDLTHPGYRLGGLAFVLCIQVWVAWAFISSQLKRSRKTKTT